MLRAQMEITILIWKLPDQYEGVMQEVKTAKLSKVTESPYIAVTAPVLQWSDLLFSGWRSAQLPV